MGTGITYADLCVADTKPVLELCASWWEESAWFKNTGMKFDSDPNYWYGLFQAGVMVGTVGRNANGRAVSAYVAVKQPYQFNQNVTLATEVVWCLDKEYRTGRNLLTLFNKIEDVLARCDVDIYHLNVPIQEGHERLTQRLEKRGFFKQDLSLFKEI